MVIRFEGENYSNAQDLFVNGIYHRALGGGHMTDPYECRRQLTHRIKSIVNAEIGMCDDYGDLVVLASVLSDYANHIFAIYTAEFGADELARAIADIKARK